MTAQTPGHAAYEAYRAAVMSVMPKWDDLSHQAKRGWEAAAQAGIDAFLAGDSVSARAIRESLAVCARPAPTQAELRDLIRKRWNEELTAPADTAVDFAQASLAAETALPALDAWEQQP